MTKGSHKLKAIAAGVAVVVFMVALFSTLGTGPEHWWHMATNAEYRRCWAMAEHVIPEDFTIETIYVADDQIHWSATKRFGDTVEFDTRICEPGVARLQYSDF